MSVFCVCVCVHILIHICGLRPDLFFLCCLLKSLFSWLSLIRNWSSWISIPTSTTISSLSSPASNLKVCNIPSCIICFSVSHTHFSESPSLCLCRRAHSFPERSDSQEQREGSLPELPSGRGRLHQERVSQQHRRPVPAHPRHHRSVWTRVWD